MEKEKPKIQVQDVHTGQTLFTCTIDESERAHRFAAQMEEAGVDVRVLVPTLSETLTNALGASRAQAAEYMESVQEETEHHEGSCCFEDSEETLH